MLTIRQFIMVIILLVCYNQQSLASDLVGLAAYKQLKKEYYIGALYVDSSSNSADGTDSINKPKTMVLRISAKKWSLRSFSRFWKQGITINNPLPGNALANDLIAFSNILKDHLIEGDQLLITRETGSNRATVTLNSVLLMKSEQPNFFNFLLNVWIGPRPPSSEFKKSILSSPTTEDNMLLLERFNNLSASSKRKRVIASWNKKPEPKKVQAPAVKVTASKPVLVPVPTPKPVVIPKVIAKKVVQKTPKIIAKTVQPKVEPQPPKPIKKITPESVIAQYRWSILEKVFSTIKYPPWALSFEQEGTVSLTVKINSDGSVNSIKNNYRNIPKIFISEVKKAVNVNSPYDAIPKELYRDTLDITFEFSFYKTGKMSTLPPKPIAVYK